MPTALVIGGADCVWKDIDAARKLFEPDAYFVTNDMIAKWPERVDYACTLHPEKVADWLQQRHKNKFPAVGEVWAHKIAGPTGLVHRGIDHTTPDWAGSSSLFAGKVALEQAFSKVVFCGAPLLAEAGHIVRKRPWTAAHAFRSGWKRNADKLKERCRSMSGWTREFLGAPTPEWLAK